MHQEMELQPPNSSRVTVTATTYGCGCMIARTDAGYRAEAEFCEEGESLESEVREAKKRRSGMSFRDARLRDAFEEVLRLEKALESHTSSSGIEKKIVRRSAPCKTRTPVGAF